MSRKIEYRLCVDRGGAMRVERYPKRELQHAVKDLETFVAHAEGKGVHYEKAWVEAREVTDWREIKWIDQPTLDL